MLENLLQEAQEARQAGDDEKAALIYEQAIEACSKDEHLADWLAVCLEELAVLRCQQGNYGQAISLYQKLITLGEKVLGSSHPDVLATIGKLANTLEADGQFDKADAAFKQAASRAERAFGITHSLAQEIRQQYFEVLSNRDAASGTSTGANIPAIKVEAAIPVKKFSSLKQPKKIKKLRYGAESVEQRAGNVLNLRNFRHHWRTLFYFSSVILGIVVLISSITIFGDLPSRNVVVQQPMEKGLFQSVDGSSGVDFIDNKYALLTHDVWHHKIPYFLLKSGTHDIWAMLLSLVTRKEYWYQLKHDELATEDGNILYASGAPELSMAEKMRKLAAFAKRYYDTYGCYPDKSEKLSAEPGLTYINPFSEKAERPSIRRLNGVDSRDSIFPGLGAEANVKDTYHFLKHGGTWYGETAAYPGGINALALFSVQRCADGYKVTEFYIHGYDRNGKMITAGLPGTNYVFGLYSGRNLNDDSKEHLQEIERHSVHPPARIYVISGQEVDLRFMHQLGFIVLSAFLALSFLSWVFLESRNRTANPRRMIQPVEAVFLLILFAWLGVIAIHWGN